MILSASSGSESAVTSASPKISVHCSFSQTEHQALLNLENESASKTEFGNKKFTHFSARLKHPKCARQQTKVLRPFQTSPEPTCKHQPLVFRYPEYHSS